MKLLAFTCKLMALLALSVAVGTQAAPSGEKVNCSNLDAVVDDLGAAQGISLLSDKYKLATSREEMQKNCPISLAAIKTLRRYNKECNSALTQQVLSSILRTREALVAKSCNNETDFVIVLDAVRCIKDSAFSELREAERLTVLSSQQLLDAKISDEKERMKRACCNVLDNRKNFLAASRQKCAKFESVYADYVDSYTSESMSLICPDAEKMENDADCSKLPALTNVDKPTTTTTLRFVSFLSPMMKLVKTLDH